MMFTFECLINSIAGVLKSYFLDAPVYSNPNQQGTKPPCFFIFFMSPKIIDGVGNRSKREIGVDIIYLTKRNIPDAYDHMIKAVDTLDNILDYIPYSDGEKEGQLKVFDREWKIDDGELHYQFELKPRVSRPDNAPPIKILEYYKGGIKGDA